MWPFAKSVDRKETLKKELSEIVVLLQDILNEINIELENARLGKSKWTISLLEECIRPEMEELLVYALKGEKYYKSSTKKYRRFESTYFITDSFDGLNNTNLGIKIYQLQRYYLINKR